MSFFTLGKKEKKEFLESAGVEAPWSWPLGEKHPKGWIAIEACGGRTFLVSREKLFPVLTAKVREMFPLGKRK